MRKQFWRQSKCLGAVAIALMLTISIADAQPPRGPGGRGGPRGPGFGGFGGPGGGMMGLLFNPAMGEELELTEEQSDKLAELRENMRPRRGPGGGDADGERPRRRRGGGDGDAEGDRPPRRRGGPGGGGFGQFAERMAEMEKQVKEILNDKQMARVKEINWQLAGPMAVGRDEDLAKALDVSDEQKEKFDGIAQDQQEAMRDLFGAIRDGAVPRDQARDKMEALRKETDEKALAVLSDEQKEKYTELLGKPVDRSKFQQFGRGGGRGRGGPGGGGPGGPPRRRPAADRPSRDA